MIIICKPYLQVIALVFIVDILVFSKLNKEELKEHLEILRRCKLYSERNNDKKIYTPIEYHGHMLSDEGVWILIRLKMWLDGPCQRIRLRLDAFEVGYLHEEVCKENLRDCSLHDGFAGGQLKNII